jgi:AcrR family transcriptional regulator
MLDAALDMFAGHSCDGASTRVIAKPAGFTQPALNYHVGGTDELWRAAVGDLLDRLRASIGSRLAGLTHWISASVAWNADADVS